MCERVQYHAVHESVGVCLDWQFCELGVGYTSIMFLTMAGLLRAQGTE